MLLPPLQFLHRIAHVIPPPRVHPHTYYGAIAPHSRLRPYVIQSAGPDEETAQRLAEAARQMALLARTQFRQLDLPGTGKEDEEPSPPPTSPKPSRFCVLMIARIYEFFPLLCPHCQNPLRFIVFLTAPDVVRPILISINERP